MEVVSSRRRRGGGEETWSSSSSSSSWCGPATFLLLFLLTVIGPNSLGFQHHHHHTQQNTTVSLSNSFELAVEEDSGEMGGGEEEETSFQSTETSMTMMTTDDDVEEEEGSGGDEDIQEGIFCPGKTVETYQSTYGRFELPRTSASVKPGTRVLSPCHHGVINSKNGAVPIFNSRIQLETPSQQDSAGLTSFCYLDIEREEAKEEGEESKGSPVGRWEQAADENLNKCREQINADLTSSVQKLTSADIITKNQVRQAIPKLSSLLRYAYKDYSSAQILLDGVSRLLEENEIFQDPSFSVYRKTLFGIIQGYAANTALQPGERVSVVSNSISLETVMFPEETLNDNDDDREPSDNVTMITAQPYDFETMHLPAEAVRVALSTSLIASNKKTPRLQLIAYSNQLFSHWGLGEGGTHNSSTDNNTTSNGNSTDLSVETEGDFTGPWRILTVHTEGSETQNLTEPIVYTLSVNRTTVNSQWQWACVLWDENARKWVSTGMRSITFPNGTIIRCESRTLMPSSAFTALLEPIPPSKPRPPKDDDHDEIKDSSNIGKDEESPSTTSQLDQTIHSQILSILSSVGSALSMTGLAITILTYILFRCLRKDRSNRILLNMSLSLFGLHLMSLISTESFLDSSRKEMWRNACLVPSFLLHYLLLSSISWMLVEALHMYSLLICVFVQLQSRFLLKRALFAWGIPFVVVFICACSDSKVYKEGRGDWCIMGGHLNLTMYYISYLGPAALMLLINCFVFVRIVRVLCQQGASVRKQTNMVTPEIKSEGFNNNNEQVDWKTKKKPVKTTSFLNVSPTQVKGAVTVMVLLGVGWTLGFFAVGPFTLVFKYLFCLCNAGQGIFIFLFRVLLHPQASRAWRRAVKRGYSSDSDLSSYYGSSSRKSQAFSSSSSSPSIISPTNTLTKSDPFSSNLTMNFDYVLHPSSGGGESGTKVTF